MIESFRREFSKLGYVEGKNITIEYRYADDQLDRLPALAEELVRLKIDLLIAPTTLEARAAKNATRTIPIVFFNVPDPVASGVVDSLSRPGGNITGFTTINAVLAGKRLELLKETIPNLSRIAVLWDPQNPAAAQQWKESQQAARELGLQFHSIKCQRCLQGRGRVQRSDQVAQRSSRRVAGLVGRFKSETGRGPSSKKIDYRRSTLRENYVASGGLMSYGPDRAEPFRRAAVMVDKILKGTKPA